jgi:hypothetical protein
MVVEGHPPPGEPVDQIDYVELSGVIEEAVGLSIKD